MCCVCSQVGLLLKVCQTCSINMKKNNDDIILEPRNVKHLHVLLILL